MEFVYKFGFQALLPPTIQHPEPPLDRSLRSRGAMAGAGGISRAYLLCYNLLQAAGWAVCLWKVGQHVVTTRSLEGTYDVAGDTVGELF